MTFITPKTFAVGEVLSAVDMNVFVRDNTAALNVGFRFLARRIFDTPGTFTFSKADPMGDGSVDGSIIRAYRIICVGGGGGGAGGQATGTNQCNPASGGSSGGYAERFALSSVYPSSVEVKVGAAGAAGTGGNGTSGEGSQFNVGLPGAVSATGGDGGRVFVNLAAPPAVSQSSFLPLFGLVGDITDGGEAGQGSLCIVADGSGTSTGGNGGGGRFGSGGPGNPASVGASFSDAQGFGGGGGGRSVATANTAAATGGNATGGLVIVELYA